MEWKAGGEHRALLDHLPQSALVEVDPVVLQDLGPLFVNLRSPDGRAFCRRRCPAAIYWVSGVFQKRMDLRGASCFAHQSGDDHLPEQQEAVPAGVKLLFQGVCLTWSPTYTAESQSWLPLHGNHHTADSHP